MVMTFHTDVRFGEIIYLDTLLMQFKDTIGSIQRAFKSAEIQVGKLVEEVTRVNARN